MIKTLYLIVNFGGPRSIDEVEPFLKTLLLDKDVVRTPFPNFIHDLLFKRIAKKRSKKVAKDYASIGGKSPIFEDTEYVAERFRNYVEGKVMTFHRYLPATHQEFCQKLSQEKCDEIIVLPQFPQFTHATTGSIARFFDVKLPKECIAKMRWVKSYPSHPSFISVWQQVITDFLEQQKLLQEETILLFSAHGVPYKFVENGDVYQKECEASFHATVCAFPNALCRLSFQSKFGPGAWLKPYTEDACKTILNWNRGRKNLVFIPISFTSDHIETLFEIEQEYLPLVKERGINAFRAPALNRREEWIQALVKISQECPYSTTKALIR
jgi:protoporphyrin/coproporphyrin ferrochelatase